MKTLLVSGGAGFIGSNFVRLVLTERSDRYKVVNFDLLTYAGNLENLSAVEDHEGYTFLRGDVASPEDVGRAFADGVDAVVHFAAESHVDRSIEDATAFLRTNVVGTQVLLDAARRASVSAYVQVSTDEVYGSLGPTGAFTEDSAIQPNSAYSASKASADLLVGAAHATFGFPGVITRCSNNYGPYQFPEKLIPLMVTNAIEDRELPVYGDGMNVRDWIHVDDHCRAILAALEKGRPGRVYNIGARCEKPNIEIVRLLLALLDKPESLIRYVKDRLGHDRRYAIDSSRVENELDWKPLRSFEEGMAQTVRWYSENEDWWRRVKSGAYKAYYERMYGGR